MEVMLGHATCRPNATDLSPRIASWRVSVALAVLLVLGGAPAFSEEAPPPARPELTELSLAELANIRVTSVSKRPEERFQSAAAIYVITSDEIRRSPARTIPQLLRSVPGVDVARVDASQWAIGIRGFTSTLSRAMLVLIDGRSVYNPLFAGTYWDVQDVLLDDIERIEIIRGPGGSLWGANAVNGIINIITRSAKDTAGGIVAGGGGKEETGFGSGRYGAALGAGGHYRVWGKYFDRDAEFHAVGDAYDAWHMYRGGFRADWDLRSSATLTMQGMLYGGHAGRRTTFAAYDPPYARTVQGDDDLGGGHLYSKWTKPVREGSELSVQAYYDRTHRNEPNFREDRDTFDLDAQYQTRLPGRQQIVAGLGYRFSDSRTGGPPTVAFEPPKRADALYSAFVEDSIEVVPDRVQLTLGSKLERNDYSGFEWQPSARLGWSPRADHFFWGAVSRTVRTPSRLDRDLAVTVATSASAPVFIRVLGTPTFESERAVVYEAGYRFRLGDRALLDLAAFHNHYPNLSSIEPGAPLREPGRQVIPFQIANGLDAKVSGAELSADLRPSARWRLRGGYALLDMTLRPRPGSRDTTSSSAARGNPRHEVTASSSWTLPRGLLVDAWYRWISPRPSRSVGAYSEIDARVTWRRGTHLELAAAGLNLLHAHHAEFDPAVEIERSIYGEAKWRW
jgi:iron complex outermembrane receptor protein